MTLNSSTRSLLLISLLLLAACASNNGHYAAVYAGPSAQSHTDSRYPHIVAAERRLQCVPFARSASQINIRGDAWTWWEKAKGNYKRGKRPRSGSVLVLRRTDRLERGHLAVVRRVLSNREILVEHANWLNQGKIHRNQTVRDVSPDNDWSAVKVWYTPGNTIGKRKYPVAGFIYQS